MRISALNSTQNPKIKNRRILNQQSSQQAQHIYNNTNPLKYMPQVQLISFGAKPTDFEQQRMEHDQQLLNLQARKEQIMEKIEQARQYDVEERKAHYINLIKEEQSNLGFWSRNFSESKNQEIIDKHIHDFRVEVARIESLYEQFDDLKAELELIERGETNIENALAKLNELEKNWTDFEKEKQAKVEKAQKINEIMKGKGGLDSCIAGYDEQKKAVTENFLKPIMDEIDSGIEQKVPNSMLLYGATGTGKTTFTEALIDNIKIGINDKNGTGFKDDVKVHVETIVIPDETKFVEIITDKLKDARNRYNNSKTTENETGTRTVYVINEVEKHIDKNEVGSNKFVRNNIDHMKSILDECAKLPNGNNERACATTFFFTTNYPTKIHDDLLKREGKIGLKIALNPAEKNDIEKILEFYTKKASDLIKQTHTKLKIDLQTVPYGKLAEILQPNKEEGAFSNDILKSMIMRRGAGRTAGALQRYEETPEKSFASHLADITFTEQRDLTKDRFENFVNIYKEMEGGAIDKIKLLLKKEAHGLIDAVEKETLEVLRRSGKI